MPRADADHLNQQLAYMRQRPCIVSSSEQSSDLMLLPDKRRRVPSTAQQARPQVGPGGMSSLRLPQIPALSTANSRRRILGSHWKAENVLCRVFEELGANVVQTTMYLVTISLYVGLMVAQATANRREACFFKHILYLEPGVNCAIFFLPDFDVLSRLAHMYIVRNTASTELALHWHNESLWDADVARLVITLI